MKKNMAITMVKDVFKEPHFQIKPTHIIFRFLVPFLLIGIGILFYSSMQKGTPYEFPFSKEEIKEVNFFNILENDSVLVDDEAEIEALFDSFRKMCIDEQLSDDNKTEAKEITLGSQGFIMTVFTKSGDAMVYQYDQLGRNAYSGYGFFSDSSNKYSVHNLDLTRIWLRLFEGS